jgi:hypothetical protein
VEEMAGEEGVGSDEIVIDEEMLDDDGAQDQEPTVSVPGNPKAISTISEISHEDHSPNSPGMMDLSKSIRRPVPRKQTDERRYPRNRSCLASHQILRRVQRE